MSTKPASPLKTLHMRDTLTDYLYQALKSCDLDDDLIEELMQMHRDDPDGYDLKEPGEDDPHPLYLLREAEQAGTTQEFWSSHKKNANHSNTKHDN